MSFEIHFARRVRSRARLRVLADPARRRLGRHPDRCDRASPPLRPRARCGARCRGRAHCRALSPCGVSAEARTRILHDETTASSCSRRGRDADRTARLGVTQHISDEDVDQFLQVAAMHVDRKRLGMQVNVERPLLCACVEHAPKCQALAHDLRPGRRRAVRGTFARGACRRSRSSRRSRGRRSRPLSVLPRPCRAVTPRPTATQ